MANILLQIEDMVNRMTLKAMLEAAGHCLTDDNPDIIFADSPQKAEDCLNEAPVLLVATAGEAADAVAAMARGVFGYILLPFVPGEAAIMVQRALETKTAAPQPVGEDRVCSLEEAEHRHICSALKRCKNNQSETAKVLGIGRNTLWRKLKKFGQSPDIASK
jgi:DNA-binding NtrC family response regulator